MTTSQLCDRANELSRLLGVPGNYSPKGRRKAGMVFIVEMLEQELAQKGE